MKEHGQQSSFAHDQIRFTKDRDRHIILTASTHGISKKQQTMYRYITKLPTILQLDSLGLAVVIRGEKRQMCPPTGDT